MKHFIISLGLLFAAGVLYTANASDESSPAADTATTRGSLAERTRLVSDLLKNYNKFVNPDKVTVKFGVYLVSYDIIEEKQRLQSYVWLKQGWRDERLQWKKEDYNVDILRLDSDDIWKPDVTLYNAVDPIYINGSCYKTNALVFPNGDVLWIPPCKFQSCCKLTIREHPYDEQTCRLKFGSWTYDGFAMDLQPYTSEKFNDTQPFDTSKVFKNASPYELVRTNVSRTEAYYPCCKEFYPYLSFNLTVRRLPGDELLKRITTELEQ